MLRFLAQLYVVPTADILGFYVERILPAKGPGGSRLEVICRTDYPSFPTKRLTITSTRGIEDLNGLASAVSSTTGKCYEIGRPEYDI